MEIDGFQREPPATKRETKKGFHHLTPKSGMHKSAFYKRALHSNVHSNLVPSTFFKHFRGGRGCPWQGPSARPGKHFATRTLRYKRAFRARTRLVSLDLFLGILGASGRGEGQD